MGPIKNPCCGEAKRSRGRAGGGKKKGKRRIDVRNRRKGGGGGRERGREGGGRRRRKNVPRGRGGLLSPFLFVFSKLGTPFRVLSISDRPVRRSRINSRSILGRELRSSARNKNRRSVSSSGRTGNQFDQFFRTSLEEIPGSLGLFL